MATSNLKEILSVVEGVRLEMQPKLSAALLERIIQIEEANSEEDDAALRAIEQAVAELLRSEEPS